MRRRSAARKHRPDRPAKCFVYKHACFVDGAIEPEIEVDIEPRANSRAIYSGYGVTVERVPWGEGKKQLTTSYCWFLRWTPIVGQSGALFKV